MFRVPRFIEPLQSSIYFRSNRSKNMYKQYIANLIRLFQENFRTICSPRESCVTLTLCYGVWSNFSPSKQ